jgi:hypothetical protein
MSGMCSVTENTGDREPWSQLPVAGAAALVTALITHEAY